MGSVLITEESTLGAATPSRKQKEVRMGARRQKGQFQIRNGRWTLKYYDDVTEPDGTTERPRRRADLGPASLSRRAADELAKPILARVNAGYGLPVKTGKPLSALIEECRSAVFGNLKPSTVRMMESHIHAHIQPMLGEKLLTEITTKEGQFFTAHLAKGRSRKTVENILMTLSSILGTARDWGYKTGDFDMRKLSLPDEGIPREIRFFTDEELQVIIKAAPEPLKTIVIIIAVLGLRIGEVLALRASDLDFRNNLIRVHQSIDAVTRLPQSTKSKSSKAILPMSPELVLMLQKYADTKNKDGFIFVNRRIRPYSANKLRAKVLHPLLKKLGIPKGGFHSIRHGTSSSLFAAGEAPTTVQRILRHSDARITLGIYGHAIPADVVAAVNRRSAKLFGQLGPTQ